MDDMRFSLSDIINCFEEMGMNTESQLHIMHWLKAVGTGDNSPTLKEIAETCKSADGCDTCRYCNACTFEANLTGEDIAECLDEFIEARSSTQDE